MSPTCTAGGRSEVSTWAAARMPARSSSSSHRSRTRSHWWVLPRFFAPSDAIERRTREGRGRWQAWADAGLVTVTPGEVVEYEAVVDAIAAECTRYDVAQIAFDPWNVEHLRQRLASRPGVGEFVEFNQTFRNYTGPMARLSEAVLQRTIGHDGNPILAWMMGNLVAQADDQGNTRPARKRSPDKIDGGVALLMAYAMALEDQADGGSQASVYDDRDPIVL